MGKTVITMLSATALMLVACSGPQRVNDVAARLDIDSKKTRRYHYLADVPFAEGLAHEGYIVALEKSPRARVGYVERESYARRFRFLPADPANPRRAAHLDTTINANAKALFVSHIVAYEPDRAQGRRAGARAHADQPRMRTRFLYNIYADRGARTYGASADVPIVVAREEFHESGWQALESSLARDLEYKLASARDAGRPYTHLVFSAMGWDNDQPESVRRYNAIIGQLIEQARRDTDAVAPFNPLVVGITWPSVWGWQSWFNLRQLAYKLFGYANKSDDADEIGYTYANWLVNRLGLQLRAAFADTQPRLRVVAVGHSFGARIMSRAVFSRALLENDPHPTQSVDLLAGLQGAFSANRFIPGAGNEGYPYAGLPGMAGRVLMTTSDNDKANPLAYYLSRAVHIGGKRGLDVARDPAHADIFHIPTTRAPRLDAAACAARDQVIVVDASDYVHDHNDVLTPEIGALLWSAIQCDAPTTDRRAVTRQEPPLAATPRVAAHATPLHASAAP